MDEDDLLRIMGNVRDFRSYVSMSIVHVEGVSKKNATTPPSYCPTASHISSLYSDQLKVKLGQNGPQCKCHVGVSPKIMTLFKA